MTRVASLHYHTIGNKIWKKTPSSKNMTTKSFSTKTDDLEKSLQLNFSRKNKIRVWKKKFIFWIRSWIIEVVARDGFRFRERASLAQRGLRGTDEGRRRTSAIETRVSSRIRKNPGNESHRRQQPFWFNKRGPGYSKHRSCITQAEQTLCSGSGRTNDLFKSIG